MGLCLVNSGSGGGGVSRTTGNAVSKSARRGKTSEATERRRRCRAGRAESPRALWHSPVADAARDGKRKSIFVMRTDLESFIVYTPPPPPARRELAAAFRPALCPRRRFLALEPRLVGENYADGVCDRYSEPRDPGENAKFSIPPINATRYSEHETATARGSARG